MNIKKFSQENAAWSFAGKALMLFAVWVTLSLLPAPGQAQAACPPVNQVVFPVERGPFELVQGFGARSARHEGRYHTGEDWALPAGERTQGQPVRAVASGLVTYAYAEGWGRDGGVVILEHQLPNDDIIYSVYGHLAEANGVTFPAGNACVQAGDVIGVIADARPAPHLHFEVRTTNGRTPGAGYTATPPGAGNYLLPSAYTDNLAAALNRRVNWVTALPDAPLSPPVSLNDDSLLVLLPGAVTRVLPDGRLFWRTALSTPAVALSPLQGRTLVHYADGTLQEIQPDGVLGETWQLPYQPTAAPFALAEWLVFPVAGGGLAALDNRRRGIAWEVGDVPPFYEAHIAAGAVGLRSGDVLRVFSRGSFALADDATLGPLAGVGAAENGELWVYAASGLWQVSSTGGWTLAPHAAPAPVGAAAVAPLRNGDVLLFDGERVSRHTATGEVAWALPVPGVNGRALLRWEADRALLLATDGTVAVANPVGGVCRVQVARAGASARLWAALAEDDTLRVLVGQTAAALDWRALSEGC